MRTFLMALVAAITVFGTWTILYTIEKASASCSNNTIEKIIYQNQTVYIDRTPLYETIAKEVANNHTYDINKYNCWDYSTDLKNALVNAGYVAHIGCGIYNNNGVGGSHDWVIVEIPIEATTGQIIPADVYKEYYHPSFNWDYVCTDKFRSG